MMSIEKNLLDLNGNLKSVKSTSKIIFFIFSTYVMKFKISMVAKIKELEESIERNQSEIKLKREQLDSLHPKLNQNLEVNIFALQLFNYLANY